MSQRRSTMEEVWSTDFAGLAGDVRGSGSAAVGIMRGVRPILVQAGQYPRLISSSDGDFDLRSISSSSVSSAAAVKRTSFAAGDEEGRADDHRHKKMIKNRESAARSRARKQAYMNELEIEVARLEEENASLKKQLDQLRRSGLASPVPKKKKVAQLQRTSSAPF